jgi:hypothetical protein
MTLIKLEMATESIWDNCLLGSCEEIVGEAGYKVWWYLTKHNYVSDAVCKITKKWRRYSQREHYSGGEYVLYDDKNHWTINVHVRVLDQVALDAWWDANQMPLFTYPFGGSMFQWRNNYVWSK